MPRLGTLAALFLALIAAPFALYSGAFGLRGLTTDLSSESRLYTYLAPNLAIFTHMIAGALITALAPLQLIPGIRAKYPQFHRKLGYTLLVAATLTGAGGLLYIALRGTIGGPLMSAGFALYGVLILIAAANTTYHAIDKARVRHRAWALRLTVLAVGSFLYRLIYGLWYWATGGVASNEQFTGLFDQFMFVGFYLPFLGLLELYLARERRLARPVRSA
ncbi:hypothetical protein FIU97_04275 [Roseivivax sp. THAF40]|uniref:DUF2306 domain-containing protein n=1 Tax=unclassified Roseivivax TaxID=2639302 RepID=UPI001268B731|nr:MULTISPECIES: DUF2306 domain-containing protein [unclassified Roseivivax]QFS81985.1 hypothetical protein FIV09_04015 [Roseivivax sp. THAF197b]QFT45785.1 hypothetical protein FIU97_04275 [Roseivivax sp. THAF40]